MNWYLHLKYLHLTCVLLTFISFSLRGYWMLTDNALLRHRLTRRLPHIIDAILLASGISLVVMFYNSRFTQPWLLLKLVGLVLYVILGALALNYGRTKRLRMLSLAGAWLTFFGIIAIARYRTFINF